MSHSKEAFEEIRVALLAADESLAEALDARAKAMQAWAELRKEEPDAYFILPRDEEAVAAVMGAVRTFPQSATQAVMREVISGCQALVTPVTVAFMGHEGGFARLAARQHFGSSARLRPAATAEAVLTEVSSGRCAYGVLPFETPYDGAVTMTLNALARSDAKISAEISLRREFFLLSQAQTAAQVKRIYGASVTFDACAGYLASKHADAVLIDVRNGLAAARRAEQDSESAALTTAAVRELSELPVLAEHVEDASDLHTRFVIVGHDYPPRTHHDRTAIAIALNDAPGVLLECLQPFAERKINVDRLETRPARGWEFRYLILIEVAGHITDRAVLAAIEALRGKSPYVRVLGSYPRAEG